MSKTRLADALPHVIITGIAVFSFYCGMALLMGVPLSSAIIKTGLGAALVLVGLKLGALVGLDFLNPLGSFGPPKR